MIRKAWLVVVFCSIGTLLIQDKDAFADRVILKNGEEVTGTLHWEGVLTTGGESVRSSLRVSEIKEVRIHNESILFILEDGGWVECTLLQGHLTLEEGGLWKVVHADTIRSIVLDPKGRGEVPLKEGRADEVETIPVPAAPAAVAEPEPMMPPSPTPDVMEVYDLPPMEPGMAELPELYPHATPEPDQPELQPEATPEPKPLVPVEKRPWEKKKKFGISAAVGYVTFLGTEGDLLDGGLGYGVNVHYEVFSGKSWFLGPELSFLRSTHKGKGFLSGVTQNVNPICIGFRYRYTLAYVDLYAKVQAGAIVFDSRGGSGGISSTVFGYQGGCGADVRFLKWFSAGPEVLVSGAEGKAHWISALAKVSVRF